MREKRRFSFIFRFIQKIRDFILVKISITRPVKIKISSKRHILLNLTDELNMNTLQFNFFRIIALFYSLVIFQLTFTAGKLKIIIIDTKIIHFWFDESNIMYRFNVTRIITQKISVRNFQLKFSGVLSKTGPQSHFPHCAIKILPDLK